MATRAASHTGLPGSEQKAVAKLTALFSQMRPDSFPEPRHFRFLHRALDLDSDLDEYPCDHPHANTCADNDTCTEGPARGRRPKRVSVDTRVGKAHSQTANKNDVIVIATEPVRSSSTNEHDVIRSHSTHANSYMPVNNWTKWSYDRGKGSRILIGQIYM